MNPITIKDKSFEVFIAETEIAEIVHSMANAINNTGIKNPLFIAVMNGAFLFAADVMRKIQFRMRRFLLSNFPPIQALKRQEQ